MFGEIEVGILVLQRDKRSSENGFQTTFGLGRKGSSLERPRAYRTHPTDGFCGIAGRVCVRRHARGCMEATACFGEFGHGVKLLGKKEQIEERELEMHSHE